MTHSAILPETMPAFIHDVWQSSGFTELTPIQEKMIPSAMQQKDIIAEAPTGSGKTLAYLLPALADTDPQAKQPQVLIVVSSHELAMQVHTEIQQWSKGSKIQSVPLIGGANVKRQEEKLKKKPQFIVGTPGRLTEHIASKKLKLHELSQLVFDEADQLFTKEHRGAVDSIIKASKRDCQKIVCSATVPEHIEEEAKNLMNTPEIIRIELDRELLENMTHRYLIADRREKPKLLRKLAGMQDFYGIAFTNNAFDADFFSEHLQYHKRPFALLHGSANKQAREQAMKAFRSGASPLLISTDVASRGIDVPELTYVISLDLPNDVYQYKHRSGRTARAGKTGTVVSLVTPGEEERLLQIAEQLNLTLRKSRFFHGGLADVPE
ncbi:DEAD/DEAH box helicase [Salisediminibacterium halotolerans]|uniref:Helicase conserved C-terminal domain-containing protein n=1 Tax=Salisediminibacterium halotolerans TaxID=517425 RepID=A0A1H9WHP0_9BACI|nr:DEAD/DEAH box helicase [Salisediminibacterium haloalkalitolerans]SES32973.1 Helicase conserved C-terminal domain-containing protein [Salisediminibacterium haloalkalitolerans]